MKVTLKILLAVAVVLLAYMCYRSIMGPIEFKDERDRRENLIKARLIDIRKAQIEYKNIHKVHAANFDELSKFLKDEKLPFLIKEGVLTDEQLEKGMTEKVPFPNALGHVCSHVCELECKRKEVSEAMSIRDIKRYAAEIGRASCRERV